MRSDRRETQAFFLRSRALEVRREIVLAARRVFEAREFPGLPLIARWLASANGASRPTSAARISRNKVPARTSGSV